MKHYKYVGTAFHQLYVLYAMDYVVVFIIEFAGGQGRRAYHTKDMWDVVCAVLPAVALPVVLEVVNIHFELFKVLWGHCRDVVLQEV